MFTVAFTVTIAGAAEYKLGSPDGRLTSEINVGDSLTFTLSNEHQSILSPSTIAMEWMNGTVWGADMKVKKVQRSSVDEVILSPLYKKSQVRDKYNRLVLTTTAGFSIEFRMYDDGMAYRFVSSLSEEYTVKNEKAVYRLSQNFETWAPYVRDRKKRKDATREQQFWNDMQNLYTYLPLKDFDEKNLLFTPILVNLEYGEKLCIAEADVEDYPGMYLATDSCRPQLRGVFAPYPKSVVQGGHNDLEHLVTSRYPYIAKINAPRTFPWRTFIVTRRDGELVENDMVYRLAAPSRVTDRSWIKPGKVAWEWWNDWGLYGVDFKAGINTETYKYYIDFASENGIEYVILDEGWATKGKCDLLDVVPEIDLQAIVDHGRRKGVDIILWAGYLAMELNLEKVVSHYADMGIKGFKIDFLNRDDQEMIDFMYRTAEVCAAHKMLVDFHGCPKPTGMQRTYPNVINYEAVFGLEQLKWSKPDVDMVSYDVLLPYIRMVAGPMDYTQGAMRNSVKGGYFPNRSNPMSQGTRCHQLAEYVVFDSPLNMLCDSPSNYMREQECIRFISQIPTVWDDTFVLDGKVGEYIVVARRRGDNWYIGALGNWDTRELKVRLPDDCIGKRIEIFSDGVNAHRAAQDYQRTFGVLEQNEIVVRLAPGGGWAACISSRE